MTHLALGHILGCPMFYFPEYPPNLQGAAGDQVSLRQGALQEEVEGREKEKMGHIQERPNTLEDPTDQEGGLVLTLF